jgi:AraC-like DNA-binding protein
MAEPYPCSMSGACAAPTALPSQEIVAYIRRNVARRITVDEIAGLARLNVFQLIRAFHRDLATTPYRLVLDMRIEHAKHLLRQGKAIRDVALHAGFADQSHLTRHFKRRTGVTPRQFYAAARASAD